MIYGKRSVLKFTISEDVKRAFVSSSPNHLLKKFAYIPTACRLGTMREFVYLSSLPQCFYAFLNAIKNEAAYVPMIRRPLSVLRVVAAGRRRRMEVVP